MKPQELKSTIDSFLESKVARLDVKHLAAIWAAALILPLVAFIFLSYSPKNKEIKKLDSQRLRVEKELSTLEATAREMPKYEKEMEETEEKFRAASLLLPQQQEIPSLLTNISSLGTGSGLDFVTFQPQSEAPKDFYAEIPVRIQVKGPYHNVGLFLYKISLLDRIVTVSDISMGSPTPVDNEMMLSTNFNLVTYRFIEPRDDKAKKDGKR